MSEQQRAQGIDRGRNGRGLLSPDRWARRAARPSRRRGRCRSVRRLLASERRREREPLAAERPVLELQPRASRHLLRQRIREPGVPAAIGVLSTKQRRRRHQASQSSKASTTTIDKPGATSGIRVGKSGTGTTDCVVKPGTTTDDIVPERRDPPDAGHGALGELLRSRMRLGRRITRRHRRRRTAATTTVATGRRLGRSGSSGASVSS